MKMVKLSQKGPDNLFREFFFSFVVLKNCFLFEKKSQISEHSVFVRGEGDWRKRA